MSLFDVRVRFLAIENLNPEERSNDSLVDHIDAYLAPLQNILDQLDVETDANLIRAKASGQPIKMRQALILLTGIEGITVTIEREEVDTFLYLESENQFKNIGLVSEIPGLAFFLPLASELEEDFSFTIGVPAAFLTPDVEAQIRAELIFFGTATQNFRIVPI